MHNYKYISRSVNFSNRYKMIIIVLDLSVSEFDCCKADKNCKYYL